MIGVATGPDRPRSVLVWIVAVSGMLIALLIAYPGQASYDAAFQLWQARTGQFWNVTPVTMPLLWSLLLAVSANPATLLALNLGLFWCGLALCIDAVRGASWLRAAALLFCGLLPLSMLQMAHLLSDAHLAAILTLASGCAADAIARRRRGLAWCALGLLVYAGAIRHNALLASAPMVACVVHVATPRVRAAIARLLAVAVVVASTLGVSLALDRAFVIEHRQTWPTIALWDLAALSVASDTLLMPEFTHGTALSVPELRDTGAFDPTTNTALFVKSRSGIRSGFGESFTDAQRAALREQWTAAVLAHPFDYVAHRLRTFVLLAGSRHAGLQGIAYVEGWTAFKDNPSPPAPLAPVAQGRFYAGAAALREAGWLSAWPFLLLEVLAACIAWGRRKDPMATLALAVATSALAYAAGFFFLAPGAELRYLTWPIVIAPVALLLALDRPGAHLCAILHHRQGD